MSQFTMTEAARQKLRAVATARWADPAQREKMLRTMRSPATRAKLRASLLKYHQSAAMPATYHPIFPYLTLIRDQLKALTAQVDLVLSQLQEHSNDFPRR